MAKGSATGVTMPVVVCDDAWANGRDTSVPTEAFLVVMVGNCAVALRAISSRNVSGMVRRGMGVEVASGRGVLPSVRTSTR